MDISKIRTIVEKEIRSWGITVPMSQLTSLAAVLPRRYKNKTFISEVCTAIPASQKLAEVKSFEGCVRLKALLISIAESHRDAEYADYAALKEQIRLMEDFIAILDLRTNLYRTGRPRLSTMKPVSDKFAV